MNNEESKEGLGKDTPCLTNPTKISEKRSQNENPQDISETINKKTQTPHKYDSKPHESSPTYIVIKNLETPIKTSDTDIRINKQENCGNSEEINKTIATTLPEYRLSVESMVHSLKAQLDQLTEV